MRYYSMRLALPLIVAALGVFPCHAEEPTLLELPEGPGSGRVPWAKGFYRTTIDGEDDKMIVLNDVTVFPPMKFKDKKQEEFYWRTLRDVRRTLPYAKLICETLLETYEYIETFPTQKEREDYLKRMEDAIFKQYKPVLKSFTKSQAQVLIKLIKRETNQSGYSIIKAFLGSFRAGFWQTFGRFFGVTLKGEYRPDTDTNDGIIERIAVGIELGTL